MNFYMKRLFLASLATVCLGICVSCGSDGEDAELSSLEYVRASHSIRLGSVWYEYFDLECVYTDVKGDTNTVGISKDTAWVEQWSREMSATEYLFEIVATPKEHHPAVREDSLYSVAKNCDLNLYAFRRGVEDEVTVSTEHTVCTDMTVKGSVLREWLRTGSRRSVVRVCTFLGDESVTEQEF